MYAYFLLYMDDCLVVSENAENIIKREIERYFALKLNSIVPLNMYLGGRLRQVTLDTGTKAWAF